MPSKAKAKPRPRPRRSPNEAEILRLEQAAEARGNGVAGSPGAQTSKRSGAQTSKAIVERADGRKRRRRTVYLPPELDRRLAVHCAGEGLEASAVIAEALAGYLDGKW